MMVEPPSPLPALPTPQQVAGLADALDQGFKSGDAAARDLKLRAIKARLDAMRLAPIPNSPREALDVSFEAARMARDAKGLAAEPGSDPALANQAQAAARAVIAKARKAVRPGSREDQTLAQLDTGLTQGIDVTA